MSFTLRLPPRGAGSLPVTIVLVTLALATAAAQQDAGGPPQQPDEQVSERELGWIHGLVTGPTGVSANGGTVSLSTDGGVTLRYNFTVNPKGEYSGRVPLGEYTLVYRALNTPAGKVTDLIRSVVILPGKDQAQDVDMTRQEYFDRLSPEQQEQLRKMKESSDTAVATGKMVASLSTDLDTANRDFEDAAHARATAIRTLGSAASASDVDSQADEIRNSKYTEIESLMSKAAVEWPREPTFWIYLGRAQVGLKNYLDAETSFKKAVDLVSKAASFGPQAANIDPQLVGAANAGLGEVYARTLMVDEANASFAAAAKADPAHAAMYLRNLAVIFFEEQNASAQIDAANEAIKADPQDALLYFIKAQGLAVDAPIDPATEKVKLSPECAAAFQKYLELASTGEYAARVTTILQSAVPQNPDPQNAGKDTSAATPPAK
jgi:tetratricopeptide (TPR) repeat protein